MYLNLLLLLGGYVILISGVSSSSTADYVHGMTYEHGTSKFKSGVTYYGDDAHHRVRSHVHRDYGGPRTRPREHRRAHEPPREQHRSLPYAPPMGYHRPPYRRPVRRPHHSVHRHQVSRNHGASYYVPKREERRKPEYKPKPKKIAVKEIKLSKYDHCRELPEGDYVLDTRFKGLFPKADPECNFVKCANRYAWINPCSGGSKNDPSGEGFCKVTDKEGKCGLKAPSHK